MTKVPAQELTKYSGRIRLRIPNGADTATPRQFSGRHVGGALLRFELLSAARSGGAQMPR